MEQDDTADDNHSDRRVTPKREQTGDARSSTRPSPQSGPPTFNAGLESSRSVSPHSDLSMFQNTGVAGPPSTPVSDFRHALGAVYCPSGM
jgi:hypothetical protein